MVSVESWLGTVDGIAVKPASMDVTAVDSLPIDVVIVDFEGVVAMPDPGTLETLGQEIDVRVTIPVRADGFDPLGDYSRLRRFPACVDYVVVAGHPSYLSPAERRRGAGRRLVAGTDLLPDVWVGTENVERVALATGGTQFELLSARTTQAVLVLRGAGITTDVAVYAPVVPTTDDDTILDSVGGYVARRPSIRDRLPRDVATDSNATDQVRTTLLDGARDVALVGDADTIAHRVDELRSVGVDYVIGYPTTGLTDLPGIMG